MSYEVDIHHVGDESQSGDAISLRYGDFTDRSRFRVVVIDGGFRDTGEKVIAHIQEYYGTNTVDLVVSTHPDNDHSSGLRPILERLTVRELWMHRLSTRQKFVSLLLESAVRTGGDVRRQQIQESIATVNELEGIAGKRGIPIVEPFAGVHSADGKLYVLGPSVDFYNQLFTQESDRSLGRLLLEALGKAKRVVKESWDEDALEEPADGATNARNNSSAILLAQFDAADHFLFTGDAGVPALTQAAAHAFSAGYNLATSLKYFQVPHHGSKRNLGPAILSQVIGPVLTKGTVNGKRAFISAARKGEPKHPSKRVTNALIRRGFTVSATQGATHCYHSGDVPTRKDWYNITPVAFSESYEEEG